MHSKGRVPRGSLEGFFRAINERQGRCSERRLDAILTYATAYGEIHIGVHMGHGALLGFGRVKPFALECVSCVLSYRRPVGALVLILIKQHPDKDTAF